MDPIKSYHSPTQHQQMYLNFQQIPNYEMYRSPSTYLPTVMKSPNQIHQEYMIRQAQEFDFNQEIGFRNLQQNPIHSSKTGQFQYSYPDSQPYHYNDTLHTQSYPNHQFKTLEGKKEVGGAYFASYSSLTPDQETIYTPSPHRIQPNQRDYFEPPPIYINSFQHPRFVPDDSPPPPNQYEFFYKAHLSEHQRLGQQFDHQFDGLKELEKVQEGMISEEKIRWSQPVKVGDPSPKDSTPIPMILTPTKSVTKKVKIDAVPITRKRRSSNLILKDSQKVIVKTLPVMKVKKRAAAESPAKKIKKDSLPSSCKMEVITEVPSPSLLKSTSQELNIDQNLQTALEVVSIIKPSLPAISTTPSNSPASPIPETLETSTLPAPRPRPNYPPRAKLNLADERDYDPDSSSGEEEIEPEYIAKFKEGNINKNGKKRAPRMLTSVTSPEGTTFGTNVKPFIAKISYLLQNPEVYGKIIQWDSSGMYLILNLNVPKLISEVLPIFFSHKSVSAFQRQLNVYQFIRISSEKLETAIDNSDKLFPLSGEYYVGYQHQTFTKSTPKSNLKFFLPVPSKARKAVTDSKNRAENSKRSRKSKVAGTLSNKNQKKSENDELFSTMDSEVSSPLTEIEEEEEAVEFEAEVEEDFQLTQRPKMLARRRSS